MDTAITAATAAGRRRRQHDNRCSPGEHLVGSVSRARAAQRGRHRLPRLRSCQKGGWRDHSWRMISDRVVRFRAALARKNMKAGDRVAILLPNGIDWVCLDVAAHGWASGGGPLSARHGGQQCLLARPFRHASGVAGRARRVGPRCGLSALNSHCSHRVWISDVEESPVRPELTGPIVRRLADVLAIAAEPPRHTRPRQATRDTDLHVGHDRSAKRRKVVALALLWNAQASAAVVPPRRDDVILSVLPWPMPLSDGRLLPSHDGRSTVAYARSAEDLAEDLVAVRPTAILGVPLLFERMSAAIWTKVAASTAKRSLLQITASVGGAASSPRKARSVLGWQRDCSGPCSNARRNAGAGGFRRPVARRRQRRRAAEQGVARMLIGLGLPVVEGYGLTEAAPVVATNGLDDNLPGSVGRPFGWYRGQAQFDKMKCWCVPLRS